MQPLLLLLLTALVRLVTLVLKAQLLWLVLVLWLLLLLPSQQRLETKPVHSEQPFLLSLSLETLLRYVPFLTPRL